MNFTKLQAAGNDFIIFNGIKEKIINPEELAKKVCERHFGVGADGMMFCSESNIADIKMNFYNADGSRAAMCGNGIRCFSKFIYDNNIVKKSNFTVETDAGIKKINLQIEKNQIKSISVDMEKVNFLSSAIPCTINKENILNENINIDGQEITVSSVLMGVPHTVIIVEDFESFDVNKLGEKIEKHSIFPKKTNVNFIKINNDNEIIIKTWERGAGRTLACGTGSCASMAIAYRLGIIKSNRAKLITEGGEIIVEVSDDYRITMIGTAKTICNGIYYIN